MSIRTAISLWLVAVAAIVTAFMLEYLAHDDFGEIRTLSLIAAAIIIGLLAATKYFTEKIRKPK